MYTRCPHCDAVFQVTTSELTAYDGNVRCGECGQIFNGLDSLSVLPPESAEAPARHDQPARAESRAHEHAPVAVPEPDAVPVPPEPVARDEAEVGSEIPDAPDIAAQIDEPAQETATEAEPETERQSAQPAAAVPMVIRDEVTIAPAGDTRKHVTRTFSLGLFSLALIGLLAGQVIYHERARLVVYPELAPAIHWMCERLGCTLPPRRDPAAFQISSRNIYSHPNAAGALMVQATLTNRADFAQPHPLVELSFRDLQGELLAVRRFAPEEYLQRGPTEESVPPGEPVHLLLEIEDPGPRAVAYEFRFH
ncbi:hypothetical protein B1C78_12010 [Thioalkalivibrio denitrificans]|uniref:Zinc finger/thioredoxin putative domain-containing protein n=1 Tax=Thioalkalivibrio denitrificans TaxID=108003 RepID=A0A1V3NDL7_9GAMM|nr:zinc-ribbon and DUF3426 domain-containing protein [Thioalkalivibrio denitrificans]OOG23197.1 hypothetical protein B1C78_12010 [Thioalkalivibrio denitrificans]